MLNEEKIKMKKKVLVIVDSFKGSLSSRQIGQIVSEELAKKGYDSSYYTVSDGGEGFLDSYADALSNLEICSVESISAIGKKCVGHYLYDKASLCAYFELADVVGIKDLKDAQLDPYQANTYGLGIVISDAIQNKKIVDAYIGIGGSASTDVGVGMLAAMGVIFYDKEKKIIKNYGNESLRLIDSFDNAAFFDKIKNIKFHILSDVNNPLLGKNGSVNIYGMQKGFSKDELVQAEANVKSFADVCTNHFGVDNTFNKGAGAAGGVGYAFINFFNATLESGIDYFLQTIDFNNCLKKYDLIITGEGAIDDQSFNGKVIAGILKYHPQNINFICGISKLNDNELNNHVYAIVPTFATLEQSMANPEYYLRKLIQNKFN